MALSDCLYLLVLGFIRSVKWIELQFLKLFSTWLKNKAIQMGRDDLGVIFHFSDESYKKWGPVEEEQALSKVKGKYDTLTHIRVFDKMFFVHVANTGTWGIGEAYVNGMWDFCKDEEDMAQFAKRILENNKIDLYFNWWNRLMQYMEFEMFNMQTRARSKTVAEKHYDLGNDLYEAMLDPCMQYSCGYWANSNNLNDAQVAKLDLIARKLNLKPGMRVLDIGCGWGMLCKFLAEKYGVECVGITISKEGAEYGRKVCKGLPVEIRIQDYRDLNESFDRIVSVGMFEHVGLQNYKTFLKVVNRILKDDGLFLLHTIGENHKNALTHERWLCTHIFPFGSTPRARHIADTTEGHFIIEDWHNFSLDYSKTLIAWRDNFKRAWPSLKGNYNDRFYRMWIYYLSISEAGFLSRRFQLWQLVLSKDGLKQGYRSVR